MTEKEQQSTRQPEDEISLLDLLEVLIRKKVLIIAITFIFTLLSIFYAQSRTPTYKATIGFLEPQETFTSALPPEIAKNLSGHKDVAKDKTSKMSAANPSPFSMFLSKITSYKLKKEVFEKGNFLKQFYGEGSIVNLETAVLAIHDSISISKEKEDENLPSFERPVYLEMTGTKPVAMSEFLNALAQSSMQDVTKEIKALTGFLVDTEINRIAIEVDTARTLSIAKKEQDILRFSEALEIAKNLRVTEHNFGIQKNSSFQFGVLNDTVAESIGNPLTVEIQDTSLPIWFLFGEKALQQELEVLKSKKNGISLPGMAESQVMLKELKSIDPSSLKIKVVTISQPSIPPTTPVKPNKIVIIAIGMVLGLFLGVIIAFIRNSMDQLRKEQASSHPA